MILKGILILIFIALNSLSYAQRVADNTFWFYFTDKNENGYSINEPGDFLSQRSIDRRAWQSLSIDETDLPINAAYIDSLKTLGLQVKHKSKWLNGVLVYSTDQALIDTLAEISFIDTIPWEASDNTFYPAQALGSRFDPVASSPPDYKYGYALDQISLLRIDYLHQMGYTGKGVIIAVLDAGFTKLKELPAFLTPIQNGQLLYSKDFVNSENDLFSSHSHGTNVSSLIIANWPDSLMGIAPDVDLILAKTEEPLTETRLEEYSWISAAEWVDSIGADILNTSLGYTLFDDSTLNYSYKDMDGQSIHISIANGMTSAKGMISVTSAGNSGNEEWYYIGAPADAFDILAVGAVDKFGTLASFSSHGPTYDHRIKPEVSAMGRLASVQSTDGTIKQGSGTSFASPLMAGATAVLWQAYPELSAKELMRKIIESSDRYDLPDAAYGYGIPNFKAAFHAITSISTSAIDADFKSYPNPFSEILMLEIPGIPASSYSLKIYDIQGRKIYSSDFTSPGKVDFPSNMPSGIYILEISNDTSIMRNRIVKK